MRPTATAPITSFVGRLRELRTVQRFLASARVLTLVGPGGCGKSRLAMEIVRRTQREDVAWVDLAPLRQGEDVGREVAHALGIASPERIASALAERSGTTRTLLVLDNCEHLIDRTAEVAQRVLSASPCTRVLATSREPLDIEGELVWRVPSLSLPDQLHAGDPTRCGHADAVKLFVERAQLAQPAFALDASTCPHVAAICRAVDGMPLAIELAAARLRHASVAELAAHLTDLLALLVGTRRNGDPRHRALRSAIDWSHALLNPPEQTVFRRLSVFAGGFHIAAAEAVCGGDLFAPSDALALVGSLVDKSLVVPPADGGRYRLLEPIREYALDQLKASGDEETVIGQCAAYLVDLVTSELPDPMGMGGAGAVRRVADEFANLTAILPWLVREKPADALRVLGRFAQNHWGLTPAHVSVVGTWLERALAAYGDHDPVRVEGLLGQVQVIVQRDLPQARRLADEAVAIATELHDETLEARALSRSAFVAAWSEPERAMREYDAAIPVLRRVHLGALALALAGRAVLRQRAGDGTGAEADIAESLAAWERHAGAATPLPILSLIAGADVAFSAGDIDRAEARLRQAAAIDRGADESPLRAEGFLVAVIEFLAHLAAMRGEAERALTLAGFTDRVRDETGVWPRPWFALTDRSWLDDLEKRLGPRAAALMSEGRQLSREEAVACALGERLRTALSQRELSVTALVADGLTDKEIAARLAISERTAESHVQRIREKLAIHSRAQIGKWAAEHAALRDG
jgi:predicted ATPase/DNA-binding CsgD family transcriptional regulator